MASGQDPDEVEKGSSGKYIKVSDKSEVKVGPSESMSKSKKNVVDPESMIKSYGADAVRWFILSDSPPEKDIQWSEQGMLGAYKLALQHHHLTMCTFLGVAGKINEEDINKRNIAIQKATKNAILTGGRFL